MKRRTFIQNTAAMTAAAALLPGISWSKANHPLGVALFTVPRALSADFEGTLKLISSIGYKELEFFGPYTFSGKEAQEQWKGAAAALGFSGSGYFGHSPKDVKALLDKYGLTAPSIHVDLPTLRDNMEGVAEAARIVGHQYVGIAMIPDDMRKNLDDYRKTIDLFNRIGENAKKHGLTFFYHNHGYGHHPVDGVAPFQMILDETDADLVKMQMDVFWFTAAGIDPVKYLKEHPGRFPLLHVKDMREKKTFPGDGGNMQEWMGLFPYLADAGDGVLDLKLILQEAKKAGAKHFLLEKDLTPDHENALQKSYTYLSGLI